LPCSSLRGGAALRGGGVGADEWPTVSPALGDSLDDEVANRVIPAIMSTSATLTSTATTAPDVPVTSLVPRVTNLGVHRRVLGAPADPGDGAASGVSGWSGRAAAGGGELVTGWKRFTTWWARGEFIAALTSLTGPSATGIQ